MYRRARAIEGRRRVTDQVGLEAEVPGHARRRRNAMICGQARDDQGHYGFFTKPILEVGADKGAVHVLTYQRLPLVGPCELLEPAAGLA